MDQSKPPDGVRSRLRGLGTALVLASLLIAGLPLVSASPAGAAVTCRTAYGEIVKESIVGTLLYRFRNTMRLCVDSNSSYSTITSASSWVSVSDVDASWDYEGLAVKVTRKGYYSGLWTYHRSQRTGHFQQCWWFYCNNLYPRMDLEGRNSGGIYIIGRSDG